MGELSELTGTMRALKNVKEVELMGMAKLKKCVLMGGLKNVKSVRMENAGKLESVNGLKEAMEEERKRREEEEEERRKEEERKRREEEERKRKEMEDRRKREEEERKKEEAERRKKAEERKRREEEERKRREEMMALAKTTVSVKCVGDLKNANCYVGVIVIASNCCNDSELNVLDLSRFVNLKELKVGDECFENVKEVKLIGLNRLERVVIGEHCFTKEKYSAGNDPDRHFYLKNCERLRELKVGDDCFVNVNEVKLIGMNQLVRVVIGKNSFMKRKNDYPRSINPNHHFYLKNCERLRELKMGCYSFSDYSVCEIENVPSLEVIEMGELNEWSWNFYYASLELKSDSQRMK